MRVRIALVVVGLAGLTLAACGGSARLSQAEYKGKLRATIGTLEKQMRGAYAPLMPAPASNGTTCTLQGNAVACVGGAGTKSLRARALRASQHVKKALDDAADSLEALEPPGDVAADNRAVVAGLRQMGDLYSEMLRVTPKTEHDLEKKAQAIRSSPTTKAFTRARIDLERKGYKLGLLTTGENPGDAVKRDTSGGGTGYGVVPNPKKVKPLPFSLVGAAGVQPVSRLSAYANTCVSDGNGMSCAMYGQYEPGTDGPIPDHLSVVRPGEKLRLSGPASGKIGSLRTLAIGTEPGSLTATKLCQPLSRPVADVFLSGPSWKAPRKPGAYVVSVSVSWSGTSGQTEETGLLGILVSSSEPLRVLPRPHCR